MVFCFNDPATPEIYTLSLHDALPISSLSRGSTYASSRPPPTSGQRRDPRNSEREVRSDGPDPPRARVRAGDALPGPPSRAPGAGPRSSPGRDLDKKTSEEHTSELQSRQYLVCRLLLEKKK